MTSELHLSKTKKIDAKNATLIAKNYLLELSEEEDIRVTLEEIEISDDESYWYVTLGVHVPTNNSFFIAQGIRETINYKKFRIDAASGNVLSMKMASYPLPK